MTTKHWLRGTMRISLLAGETPAKTRAGRRIAISATASLSINQAPSEDMGRGRARQRKAALLTAHNFM